MRTRYKNLSAEYANNAETLRLCKAANLALDPDPSWIVLGTQQADADVDSGRSLAFAANLGALGVGIHTVDSPTGDAWWTVSSGLGIRLARTVALGGHLGWQLPEGPDNNFMTGDLALTWRPARACCIESLSSRNASYETPAPS